MASLDTDSPMTVITAGWRDRKDDDGELLEHLGGRATNLRLFARWQDCLARDARLADWDNARQQALDESSAAYTLRLHHQLVVLHELQRQLSHHSDSTVLQDAIADALGGIQALDEWHLVQVTHIRELFAQAIGIPDVVAEHRFQVREVAAGADTLVIAGGHVGSLLDLMRAFDVTPDHPYVLAWSAGAMVLTERIVLIHDQGYGHPEVHDRGLGAVAGLVALPHARTRLNFDRRDQVGVLAQRLSPALCAVLDEGVRIDVTPAGITGDLRVLDSSGRVHVKVAEPDGRSA